MKDYIEMKAAGAAGVRVKDVVAKANPLGILIIEHWRHRYSDVNGRRMDDKLSAPLDITAIEDDIERLSTEIKAKEERIKNLLAIVSDIKEIEFSMGIEREDLGPLVI